ncbi:hypothetical protein MAM1_0090d04876 [Mucor ambiguus]|uniref:Uncharacterized protein n=1 Tax=Mucor ambiguus TaxID=91626 RepID=A0A0C9LUP9_9FUNG|nr:hypothetical protein MAM1_0090d04876 [Mucor ambiguus]
MIQSTVATETTVAIETTVNLLGHVNMSLKNATNVSFEDENEGDAFNILVTGSILLHPSSTSAASVGPSCHSRIANTDFSKAALYIREENSGDFLAAKERVSSVKSLRQLTTGLNRP